MSFKTEGQALFIFALFLIDSELSKANFWFCTSLPSESCLISGLHTFLI